MARIAPILKALATVTWRELRSLNAVTANNFFLFTFALFALQPPSAVFLQVILGLLLFFPLSADPMRKIPPDRLALLPLSGGELIRLRAMSIFLSPVIWLIAGVLIWGGSRFRGLSYQLLFLAVFANAATLLAERFLEEVPRLNLIRDIPQFPSSLGGLIRKNIREMLHVLDPYAGLVLTISGVVYRFAANHPEPEALFGITMLAVLSLSTYGQRLFALDSAFTRYYLMPLKGWQVLLAKDIAFLVVLLVLVLPLAPLAGIAAGLAVLAVGHQPSVMLPSAQSRWRFVAGASITHGIVQTICMFGAGTLTYRSSPLILVPCAVLWVLSLFYFGWRFDRR
ncbi:MAG TPA: hypothetical protein VM120_12855 [Bryobacteraceae bacterium]|nr:hypothetical protein [Bryobacteraceae bacterium]